MLLGFFFLTCFCLFSRFKYVVDPATGQEKKKKKLGGAYPGQRRPQHRPHMPNESQFGPDGKATVHFKVSFLCHFVLHWCAQKFSLTASHFSLVASRLMEAVMPCL